jgi:hypothetical protein
MASGLPDAPHQQAEHMAVPTSSDYKTVPLPKRSRPHMADCVAKVWFSRALVCDFELICCAQSFIALAAVRRSRQLRWLSEPCHLSEVLSDGCEGELILSTGWSA